MTLQWHLTDRCNLKCTHCYQDSRSLPELEYPVWLEIVEQFRDFVEERSRELDCRVRGHFTLTGGEPFVHSGFEKLLQHISVQRNWASFSILTNGSLIDADLAKRLADMRVGYVQVSIEGLRASHDSIRGEGQFQLSVDAIERLVAAGVRTLISFTAHSGNYREFGDVAELARQLNVARVWADRLVPCGRGCDLPILSSQQTYEFLGMMRHARDSIRKRWFNRTEVSMHRALQFLLGGSRPYRCAAGDTLLTVMPNGDLYPCRRMPVHVGNVTQTTLSELYNGDFLSSLRDRQRVSKGCRECLWKMQCGGGLKCLSYAVTGDPFTADPGCWLANANSNSS